MVVGPALRGVAQVPPEFAILTSLRVLHVYRTYYPDPPGGLQEAIRQICSATQRYGVRNSIFTLSPHRGLESIQREEGDVFRSRSWAAPASCDIGGIGAFRQFARLAKAADVIHYHFPWPFADLLHLSVKPRAPAVLTYHSDIVRQRWLGRLYVPIRRRMLRSMALIAATSPVYAETSPVLNDPQVRTRVRAIPLGIDECSYPDGDEAILNRLGIAIGEPYFLFVGVLRYYKGLRTLVQAATDVGCPVVIAGAGPEMQDLAMQARESGANNVVFAGHVSDAEKVALLRHCLALILPSHLRSEAFGMVLVEAAMFGKPAISCEIGTGTTFVNVGGETGLVVSPESPTQLSAAMKMLLSDEALVVYLGAAARQRYERLFSGVALGTAYVALYRDAIVGASQ